MFSRGSSARYARQLLHNSNFDRVFQSGAARNFGNGRWSQHGLVSLKAHQQQVAKCANFLGRPYMLVNGVGSNSNRIGLVSVRTRRNFADVAAKTKTVVERDSAVGYWLLGVAGLVFGMVVLGGVTRLTRSGLSMVDWRPQGSWLPSTDEAWQVEFDKYKQFPEYKKLNMGMNLEEFKKIYFMEWAHRMWGRGLGFAFGLPLIYFLARGRIQRLPGMGSKLFGLFLLGGGQGLVGWWMVKSGLEEQENPFREPRVSAYRLAAHLTVALGVYTGLLWTGLTALNPAKMAELTASLGKQRRLAFIGTALVGITFVSGAFVAGNDAGRAYNDWPMFAGNWIPQEIWDETLQPAWRNLFENTATVQFDHRNLAYTTFLFTVGLWHIVRKPGHWGALQRSSQLGYHAMLATVCGQVALGISTLMMFVPVSLASMHQAGALTLWSTLVYIQHTLRYVRK